MMKKLVGVAAAAAFAAPMAAGAAQPIAIDGYYVADAQLDTDVGDDDGDGFGARIMVPFAGSGLRLHAEYQSTSLDDTDVDIDQLRLGAGWMTEGNARFGVVGEYISAKFDGPGGGDYKPDGYGVHGRAEFSASEQFLLYGQIGYVDIGDNGDDVDGVEYLAGGVFNITPMWGVGVDYRYSDLELDESGSPDFSLEDLRVGVRINLGV